MDKHNPSKQHPVMAPDARTALVHTSRAPAPRGTFWQQLEMALEARVAFALAALVGDRREAESLIRKARNIAYDMGSRAGDTTPNTLIAGQPELAHAWRLGREVQLASGKPLSRQVTAVERSIADRDWRALDLPSPDVVLNGLATYGKVTVCGHTLVYTHADGPAALKHLDHAPVLEIVECFLIDIARSAGGHSAGVAA